MECARDFKRRPFPRTRKCLACGSDCRGSQGQSAAGLMRRMRDATYMPKLKKDEATFFVDSIGDQPPARYLFVRVNAGCGRVTLPGWRDLCRFRDQKAACACALGVVPGIHLTGDVAGL